MAVDKEIVDLKCEIKGLDYLSLAIMFCFAVIQGAHSYKTLNQKISSKECKKLKSRPVV